MSWLRKNDRALAAGAGDEFVHPVEAAEVGALAAAGGADDGRDLTGQDIDVDAVQDQRVRHTRN